jgi:dual specificity MAP kinase phosphatase
MVAAGAQGRVLVHCSQGVSRSTTIVIAYIMWKTGQTYDQVYQAVRNLRGVCSPNIGFTCQLLQWQVRAWAVAASWQQGTG